MQHSPVNCNPFYADIFNKKEFLLFYIFMVLHKFSLEDAGNYLKEMEGQFSFANNVLNQSYTRTKAWVLNKISPL
jgi:hypothetical protein